MTNVLKIALAQLNPTVGAIARNLAKARTARADAARLGADLILFTELYMSGYPPEDLVLKPSFVAACMEAVRELARDTADGGPADGRVVAVRGGEEGQLLATSFHPELTGDARVHELFLRMVKERS